MAVDMLDWNMVRWVALLVGGLTVSIAMVVAFCTTGVHPAPDGGVIAALIVGGVLTAFGVAGVLAADFRDDREQRRAS